MPNRSRSWRATAKSPCAARYTAKSKNASPHGTVGIFPACTRCIISYTYCRADIYASNVGVGGALMNTQLNSHDALIVVDVQNDFCSEGRLAVSGGDEVVPVLNRWIERATQSGALVVASRCWHPPGHISFKERGGVWPEHCVQESAGAEF